MKKTTKSMKIVLNAETLKCLASVQGGVGGGGGSKAPPPQLF